MYNELFSIGPVTIYGYGLMIGLGIVAALLLGDFRAKKKKLNGDFIYGLTLFTVVVGFLCARILFILTDLKGFVQNPMEYIMGNGFVVFGGILGGILAIFLYCKWKKADTWAYIDLMIPSVALAQGFGRIGCFLAGCCYGRETNSIIGVVFQHSAYAPNGVKLIPTQLIMAAGDFIITGILIWYAGKTTVKGRVGALYLILYSVGRFIVEFFRNDERGAVGVLSTSQFIGIFMLAAGILIFNMLKKRTTEEKEEISE